MVLLPQGAPKSFKIHFHLEKGHSAEDRAMRRVKISNIKGNRLQKNWYSCHLRLFKVFFFFQFCFWTMMYRAVTDRTNMINFVDLYLCISTFAASFTTGIWFMPIIRLINNLVVNILINNQLIMTFNYFS